MSSNLYELSLCGSGAAAVLKAAALAPPLPLSHFAGFALQVCSLPEGLAQSRPLFSSFLPHTHIHIHTIPGQAPGKDPKPHAVEHSRPEQRAGGWIRRGPHPAVTAEYMVGSGNRRELP